MSRIEMSNEETDKLFKATLDTAGNYECPESFEGGKCNMKEILGYDCDDNDNHCVAKEVLTELSFRMKRSEVK